MNYEYKFNSENCWFKDNCENYKTDNCNQFCRRYKYLHYQANHSLLKPAQQYPAKLIVPKNDTQVYTRLTNIRADIVNYVQSGNNLVLMSKTCGVGKTTWMTKLAMQYMSKIQDNEKPRVLFLNCAKFAIMQKNMCAGYVHKDLPYILDNIERVDLVVWDDLAITDLTSYDFLNLYVYINDRMDSKKSNFFTLNCGDKTISEVIGPRLYSRVVLGSEVLEFKSKDARGLNL